MTSLVLNSDYSPIGYVSIKRVISRPHAFRVVEYYENSYILDSSGRKHKIPAVVVINKHIKNVYRLVKYSRASIYLRDDYTCQYTGIKYPRTQLSIDHIIPKSKIKGNPNTFENTVTCHRSLNSIKGDKTPEEAGLRLISQPRKLTYQDLFVAKLRNRNIPKEWERFLERIR